MNRLPVSNHPVALRAVILSAVILLSLAACGVASRRGAGGEEDRPVVIGFSAATDTFIIERWNKDIKIFTSTARELGAEVIFQLSAGGTQEQINQIRYLLGQNIDVLVVIAHDTDLLSGVIKTANDRRIPVLAYDRLVQGVPVTAYVSFDNVEVGRHLGRALTEAVPRGDYLIVNGSIRDNNSYLVNEGLHEILRPHVTNDRIRVLDEIWLEEWSTDEATEKVRAVLDQINNVDAVSAANDQLANAVIQLLAERRLAGDVAVVGQDADLLSAQRVVEGLQLMTVYKPIQQLASRAAEIAVAMAENRMPSPDSYMDNGSGTPVPFFMERPIAVFRHNMDETIIRDGFHSAEDVYRTVRARE